MPRISLQKLPFLSASVQRTLLAIASGLVLLAISAVAGAARPVAPPPPPPPPVTYTASVHPGVTLWRVNEAGVAVGWTGEFDSPQGAVVRLADGTLVDLTEVARDCDPDYEWTHLRYALEINAAGQIAGGGLRVEDGIPTGRLFRFTPESVDSETGLPIPARLEAIRTFVTADRLFIKGMNDAGDVVLHATPLGTDTLPAQPRAEDSVWVFSGPPGLGSSRKLLEEPAVPGGINNHGEVTGAMDTGNGTYAFIAAPDGTYDLFGTINGAGTSQYDVSEGMDINDAGTIVGWARSGITKGKEDTRMRAVGLRSDGSWADLTGAASGANSWATAINSPGVTVGAAGGINGLGFIMLSGKAWSLKELLVSPPANLTNVGAKDISDSGVICGSVTIRNADGTTSESAAILVPSAVPVP